MKKIIYPICSLILLFVLFLISIESAEAIDVTSCGNITSPGTYNLINNLTSQPGQNCILVTSGNVSIDCGGNGIFFSGNGFSRNYAIYVHSSGNTLKNVSIMNCDFIGRGIINMPAIEVYHANDIFIINNSLDIETLLNDGIIISNSDGQVISKNAIYMNGSTINGLTAIRFYLAKDSLVANNSIYLKRYSGLRSLTGIYGSFISNLSVEYNNITTNTITPFDWRDSALRLDGYNSSLQPKIYSFGNIFKGYGGFKGIFIEYPPLAPPFPTDIISENDYIKIYPYSLSYPGRYSGWAYPLNSYVRFKNITFATEEGSINLINDSQVISFTAYYGASPTLTPDQSHINISNNLAHLNSTAFPDMNKQAIITLLNLQIKNPIVERLDNRKFRYCPPPFCRILNSTGSNVTFYVENFDYHYYRVAAGVHCRLCGDVNDDGVVNSADAMIDARIANRLIVPNPLQFVCGDVNSDGTINVLDALLIARKSAGIPVVLRCA